MCKYALALWLACSIPAAAIEACSILNPIEIAATLRQPGVVVAFHSNTDRDHFHTCILARISSAGSFDENLKRFKSEAPPTLMVALGDDLGARGFDLLKPQPEGTSTEVAGIGDRAVLRRGTKEVSLFVASGKNFLQLGLGGETPTARQEQDLMDLAREALATNFDGAHVGKFEIAEHALDTDKAAFEADPKNFAIFLAAMKRLDEARIYNLQAAAANPYDSDTLYIQGVLDWFSTNQPRMGIRARGGLSPTQSLSGPECAEVRNANQEKVEDGIASLTKRLSCGPISAMPWPTSVRCTESARSMNAKMRRPEPRISRPRAIGATRPWLRKNLQERKLSVEMFFFFFQRRHCPAGWALWPAFQEEYQAARWPA